MKAILTAVGAFSVGLLGIAFSGVGQALASAAPNQLAPSGLKADLPITNLAGVKRVGKPACLQGLVMGGEVSADGMVRLDGNQKLLLQDEQSDSGVNPSQLFYVGRIPIPQGQPRIVTPSPLKVMPLPNWSGGAAAKLLPLAQGLPPTVLVTTSIEAGGR